uniref:Putative secreted protein n=1 Tax=Ixodes ricinus TaxID=34613 RepID=A0A147BC42_IXORI
MQRLGHVSLSFPLFFSLLSSCNEHTLSVFTCFSFLLHPLKTFAGRSFASQALHVSLTMQDPFTSAPALCLRPFLFIHLPIWIFQFWCFLLQWHETHVTSMVIA